jgi:UDP-glucose 4-epimerase
MTSGVLVVGGFGTIGGRLSERLESATDIPIRLSSRTLRQAPTWASRASTCIADVTVKSGWHDALNGMDTVVHLVSLPDFAAKENPELARTVGVDGTRNVLEASIAAGTKRFIFLSTGHVYGTPYVGHITEDTPTNPQQPYANTHLEAERLVADAHERGDIEGVRVRLSNGFGFPKRADNEIWRIIINDLCRQAVTTGRLELRTPGVQRRNFIPFADVCTALVHLINMPRVGDGLFNLGSTVTMTIADAARRVQERAGHVLGKQLSLTIPTGPREDAPELDYDSTKIRSTGLTLTDDLDTEIDALLRYCAETFA